MQVINVRTLGLSTTISGLILAIDNIIGLFILPLSGKLSDKCKSKYGRRTPFIFVGTVVALTGMAGVAIAASRKILWLYIVFIVITLFAMAARCKHSASFSAEMARVFAAASAAAA